MIACIANVVGHPQHFCRGVLDLVKDPFERGSLTRPTTAYSRTKPRSNTRRDCSKNRQGVSLIEMMVVISVSTTLMVIAVGWIHQSFKLASVSRARQTHHQNLSLLGRQFRDDVQRAATMSVEGESELVLQIADQTTLVYSIESFGVRRIQREDNETVSQEFYRLSAGSTVSWESSELPDWITLRVHRSPGFETADSKTLHVDRGEASIPVDLFIRVGTQRYPMTFVAMEESQ